MAPVAAGERRSHQDHRISCVTLDSRPLRRDGDIYQTNPTVEQGVAQFDQLSYSKIPYAPARPSYTFTFDITESAATAASGTASELPDHSDNDNDNGDGPAPRGQDVIHFNEDLDGSSVPPFGFKCTTDFDAFDNDIDAAFEFETHDYSDLLTATTPWNPHDSNPATHYTFKIQNQILTNSSNASVIATDGHGSHPGSS